jgi:hypothetical protein
MKTKGKARRTNIAHPTPHHLIFSKKERIEASTVKNAMKDIFEPSSSLKDKILPKEGRFLIRGLK